MGSLLGEIVGRVESTWKRNQLHEIEMISATTRRAAIGERQNLFPEPSHEGKFMTAIINRVKWRPLFQAWEREIETIFFINV